MDNLLDAPFCAVVVEAHDICLETAITVLNIRGAPPCLASLGKALESLANTLRKLDFAWHHNEDCTELEDQDARRTVVGALRGCARVYEVVLNILNGHLWDTSTPNLRIFHEDKWVWQEKEVLSLIRQTDSYKAVLDRVVLLAL